MGRRSKIEILENLQEHDFELRPINILPVGYEDEAIQIILKLLTTVKAERNVVLEIAGGVETIVWYRFAKEVIIPAETDIIDRETKVALHTEISIIASCAWTTDLPAYAYLFDEVNGVIVFNNWLDVEVEYKNVTDPRRRRILKYP